MQYSTGSLGRIFVVRFDDGEDFLQELSHFVRDQGIASGLAIYLGALMEGRMVTGPEEAVIPPVPHVEAFSGGWEVFGVASIYPGAEESRIHYHASIGRGTEAFTGCIRQAATAYLVVEAIIFEFAGLNAQRGYDERTGLILPMLERRPD